MGILKGDTNAYDYLEELQVALLMVKSIEDNWDMKGIET